MHDHDTAKAPDTEKAAPAAAKAAGPAASTPTVLQLQRQIGNRAVGRLLARTPEETVELVDQSLLSLSPDSDHLARTFSPFAFDGEGLSKVSEAYTKKHEKDEPPGLLFPAVDKLGEEDKMAAKKNYPAYIPPPKEAGGA